MKTSNSSENIDHNHRRFFGTDTVTIISGHSGTFSFANAETTRPETTKEEEPMTTAGDAGKPGWA
ncbi:MAG: hypothetical protein ACLP00_29540 [Terracidiphilus sp.]